MSIVFPCEKVKWELLPAIRRTLVVYLVKEKKIQRKKVCEMLDLTPAALTQYIQGKRGKGIKLSKKEIRDIKSLGNMLLKGKNRKKAFVSGCCSICRCTKFSEK